jgi:galactose mutarotase-like enzyme
MQNLTISSQGGYVTSWADILYQGSKIQRTGIPILFPHFGKSDKYRMHGFARDSLWHTVSANFLELTDQDIDEKAKTEYPFKFKTQIQLELINPNTLRYKLSVQNTGTEPMPIMPGLHPYWSIPHDQKSQIQIHGLPDFDATTIDWTNNPPDNTYDFPGEITAGFPNKKITIKDISQDKNIKNLVIWSQTPTKDPDYNFICIEPICGPHYAIDKNPIYVHPNETWEMKLEFKIT